jgi:hypothetical protein
MSFFGRVFVGKIIAVDEIFAIVTRLAFDDVNDSCPGIGIAELPIAANIGLI